MVFATTTDGRFLDLDPACARLYGRSREEQQQLNASHLCADARARATYRAEIEAHGSVADFELTSCARVRHRRHRA